MIGIYNQNHSTKVKFPKFCCLAFCKLSTNCQQITTDNKNKYQLNILAVIQIKLPIICILTFPKIIDNLAAITRYSVEHLYPILTYLFKRLKLFNCLRVLYNVCILYFSKGFLFLFGLKKLMLLVFFQHT